MKNFWGSFFGAITGIVVSSIICTVIFLVGMVAFLSSAFKGGGKGDHTAIAKNTVLELKLDYAIPDQTEYNPFANGFQLDNLEPKLGLADILATLKYAKADEKIKGIYLELSDAPSGIATLEEIRDALIDFRKSGKFVYTYSNGLSQKAYYVASASDEIYLHPMAGIDFKGLGAELMFFKNTLDKLGVEPVIIRPTGNRFKSAVEPFFLDKASESNRLQLQVLLSSMWSKMSADISAATGISPNGLDEIANGYSAHTSIGAKQLQMIKGIMYPDEMEAYLKSKLELKEDEKINKVELGKYFTRVESKLTKKSKEKIAIIYASGEIVSGKGSGSQIGGDTYAKLIKDAREDDEVKAIVLRVNSPGGDAFASDLIWREVYLTEKKKPIVVSMGNYAASGGYYIACAADTIVADQTTLTGSIGVFSVMFNLQKLLNEKIGITFDTVKTHRFADFPSVTRPIRDIEKAVFQSQVDEIYSLFLHHVADGRGLNVDQVDSIGQGRVWTGQNALEIGLVDVLGGLDSAVVIASKMAKLSSYEIVSYPEDNDPFSKFFRNMSASETSDRIIEEQIGSGNFKYYQQVKKAKELRGIQARLPFMIEIQ